MDGRILGFFWQKVWRVAASARRGAWSHFGGSFCWRELDGEKETGEHFATKDEIIGFFFTFDNQQ